MKKIFYLFIVLISFISISIVKADTLITSSFYDNFNSNIEFYLQYTEEFDEIISFYESEYSVDYPYYYVSSVNNNAYVLQAYDSNNLYWSGTMLIPDGNHIEIRYEFSNSSSSSPFLANDNTGYMFQPFYNSSTIFPVVALYSNDFIFKGYGESTNYDDYTHFNTIIIPSYTSFDYDLSISEFEIKENQYFPSYLSLYDGSFTNNYLEINLNNYSYIALSLKDYSNNSEFTSTIYTKGQLCLTPVYNYGMTEKSNILDNNYQVQGCTPYYDDYTPIRVYILSQDINNHSIYYIKPYDLSIENKIKVDSSIFDITYIDSSNVNNPYVTVNGKSYPTIPYDDLNSSATLSEQQGYIPGVSCVLGDLNCTREYSDLSWTNIFSHPLQTLETVWTAIITILSLITQFITLLPPVLQGFLYLSFSLAIVLGIIKILL